MAKTKIQTKGMHCQSCEILLKDAIEELPGVFKAEASHKSGIIIIEFNEEKIQEAELFNAIRKEGYKIISGD